MKPLLLIPILFLALASRAVFAADNPKEAGDPDIGTAITVIFDNSGSMRGEKIDEAKAAFQTWLAKASDTYTWSLIDFDDGGRLVVPFGRNQAQVAAAIAGFNADTNTPIVNALKIAMQQVQERRAKVTPYERHLVLLFTDGEENQDPGGDDEVLNVIRKMRAINIEVVGIGYHGDGDYLAAAATHYYQADNLEALKNGLNKVDAEVDLSDEIKVNPDDLKAMTELPIAPKATDAAAPAAADSTAATQPPNAGAGFLSTVPLLIGCGVVALILLVVVRSVMRGNR